MTFYDRQPSLPKRTRLLAQAQQVEGVGGAQVGAAMAEREVRESPTGVLDSAKAYLGYGDGPKSEQRRSGRGGVQGIDSVRMHRQPQLRHTREGG